MPGRVRRPVVLSPAEAGFTMVEIAICIAVVAFAMVAIIGVLPTGFQVQKDNREDTLINQEGLLWVEAIRSGARGMDYLTNHVDLILRTEQRGGVLTTNQYLPGPGFRTGLEIVGLLTQPKYRLEGNTDWVLQRSRALVRAIGGSAVEKTPTNEFAFTYLLTVEAVPFSPFPPALTNFQDNALAPAEQQARRRNFLIARNLEENAHQLRVVLEWPAERHPQLGLRVGNGRKVFRVLANGSLETLLVNGGSRLNWKQPAEFRLAQ